MVTLTIDHKTVTVPEGTTILEAARRSAQRETPILGINLGRVGYMAELEMGELELLGRLFDRVTAEGHIPADSIPARLDTGNRSAFGRTAPAEGLYLNRVFYNDPETEGYHPEKGGGV